LEPESHSSKSHDSARPDGDAPNDGGPFLLPGCLGTIPEYFVFCKRLVAGPSWPCSAARHVPQPQAAKPFHGFIKEPMKLRRNETIGRNSFSSLAAFAEAADWLGGGRYVVSRCAVNHSWKSHARLFSNNEFRAC
jgi:hypothetical protein